MQAYGVTWRLGQVAFFRGQQRVQIGGPYSFTSAWMSAGMGEEWVYVDLGAGCVFDRIALYWIARAAEGSVQVSDDAQNWRDLLPLPAQIGLVDDLKLAQPAQARYVRVLMTRPSSPDGYILSEIEVFGHGGFVARPKPASLASADGRLDLSGGAWRLQRSNLANAEGEALSQPGFQDSGWLVATVKLAEDYNNGGQLCQKWRRCIAAAARRPSHAQFHRAGASAGSGLNRLPRWPTPRL
jgi:hypothetical protein